MRKLVPESIEETLQLKHSNSLNEIGIRDFISKTKEAVKSALQKIGNLFVAMYQGAALLVMLPVNIGILFKTGKLPKAVRFVASENDVEIEPSLANIRSTQPVLDRVRRGYLHDAALNKKRGKLKLRMNENYEISKHSKLIKEAMVPLKYQGKDIRNVGAEFLIKRILMQTKNPKLTPPLIWGAPGIGKTAITNAVIKSLGPGNRLIDVQLSKMAPDDWTLPSIYKITAESGKEIIKAQDIPKNWLPVYVPTGNEEIDSLANDKANAGNGGIIFLDELSRASAEVQNTCLKLVHERMIGDAVLGSKWAIVAATNREEDDPEGGQTTIGSALANRFQHWNFVPTVDDWIEWAKGKIDDVIVTFIEFNRDHFYLFDNEMKVNTTPRSWEALSSILQSCKDYGDITWSRADIENIVAANVNTATVEAFMAFSYLIESIPPDQIKLVFSDPSKAPKPKKSGSGYDVAQANALMGVICSQSKDKNLTAKELENYVEYWLNLDNQSLAAKALWLIVETHPYIHQETGDIKGKEKYKKAMDMYRAKYGNPKVSGSRSDVMGA